MDHFQSIWLYDNSTTAFINNSVEAELAGGTAFELMDETSDYQYFGFPRRVSTVIFKLAVAGSLGALTWEYTDDSADADSWARTIPQVDSSLNSTTHDNYVILKPIPNWASVAFSTTKPHAVASVPDTTARFWLRVSAASITTAATVNEIQCVPYAHYTTPSRVSAALQIADFSTSTQPTLAEVEDTIRSVESRLDYRVKKSWRYNLQTNEYHGFNLSGIRLRKDNVRDVISLQIWDGASFETKTGSEDDRKNDYFFIPEEGMVYFSRYFLLPARLAYVGPHWWGWGVGEFTKAIKITYIWGRDKDTDERGYEVELLATKMAAIELFRSHDYSAWAISGSDRVPISQKIDQWTIEVEDGLESLRGWEVI